MGAISRQALIETVCRTRRGGCSMVSRNGGEVASWAQTGSLKTSRDAWDQHYRNLSLVPSPRKRLARALYK
ncbi:MAG: hypothetical protein QOI77_2686 [Blastocatellia bacterium]|nr:hypothetical protein [Blastocatellia bacterium]